MHFKFYADLINANFDFFASKKYKHTSTVNFDNCLIADNNAWGIDSHDSSASYAYLYGAGIYVADGDLILSFALPKSN